MELKLQPFLYVPRERMLRTLGLCHSKTAFLVPQASTVLQVRA